MLLILLSLNWTSIALCRKLIRVEKPKKKQISIRIFYRESVAGSVIQATGTVEFEDGLRTGVLPGGCWCPCGGPNPNKMEQSWECIFLNVFTHIKTKLGWFFFHHWTSKLLASMHGRSGPLRQDWPCTPACSSEVQNLFFMLILSSYV